MDIKTVTVIGVTGTMGANVAGIFASFGEAKVYALGRDFEKVKNTIPRIVKSVRTDSISKNITPADFSMIEQCIAESDLVFESSAENIEIKKSIHKNIAKYLRSDAIACSGTSGLSITEMAECYSDELRKNFFGVHMFNPPYSMSLCELTPTRYSDSNLLASLHSYLEEKLYRTVVEVEDSPAFLANRIGLHTINEALKAAEEHKKNGGIDYIDAILGPFTGRNMAPVETADFIGLDVHKAVIDNIHDNTKDYANDDFVLPTYVEGLIAEGKLGKKTKEGLYRLEKKGDGSRKIYVYDIETNKYRDLSIYDIPFAKNMKKLISEGDYNEAFKILLNDSSKEAKMCVEFLLKYIVYSLFVADEIGESVQAADDAMATGFNWCPPLALYQAFATVVDVESLIRERIPNIIEKVNWKSLSSKIIPSNYDYRSFFRSGK